MIITIKGADFSAKNIGTLSTWTIFTSLGSGATYSGNRAVDKGSGLSATITIADGYELGSAGVSVVMGTTDVTSSAATVNGNTITISIATVTGNVTIKVPTLNTSTGEEDGGSIDKTITLYMTDYTVLGQQLMWYQDIFKLMAGGTVFSKYKAQLCACDVSSYVGKEIKITANQAVIDGAYYSFFLNDVLFENWAPQDLPNKGANDGASSEMPQSLIIEKFVVSVTTQVTNTLTKTVPAGTKYLYFVNLNEGERHEPKVELA